MKLNQRHSPVFNIPRSRSMSDSITSRKLEQRGKWKVAVGAGGGGRWGDPFGTSDAIYVHE